MAYTVVGKDGTKFTVDTIEGISRVLKELSASSEEASETSEEESPLLTSDQLKEGDKVRILTEPGIFEPGEFHGHVEGSIGIVTEVVSENIIEVEAPGELSPSETIIQGHSPSRLERVEPIGKDANGEDLFEEVPKEDDLLPVGTRVRLLQASSCGDLREGEEGTISWVDKGCSAGLEYSVRVREGSSGYGWFRKDGVEVIEEKTFKVGDMVRVTGNSSGHSEEVGEVREIKEVDSVEPKYNLSQELFGFWANTKDIELVADSEAFVDGDLVKVTESFVDGHGDVAAGGSIFEYEDWGDGLIFLGTVVLGDNYDKIHLVCRKEDRKDIDL